MLYFCSGLFPVGIAVVSEETDSNGYYFFTLLKEAIGTDCAIRFVSDRNHEIISGVKTLFPNGFHTFCMVHLKNNSRERLKGDLPSYREFIVSKFNSFAYAACYKETF